MEYINPKPIYARVREELKSFFNSGMAEDTLFPIYTRDCLDNLGKGTRPLKNTIINVTHCSEKLPLDFYQLKEAWIVTEAQLNYTLPNYTYETISTKLSDSSSPDLECNPCTECANADIVTTTYKTSGKIYQQFQKVSRLENYTIVGKTLNLEVSNGHLYIIYYSENTNDISLIPNTRSFLYYLEHYLKYKVFEHLKNNDTSGSYAMFERECSRYKALADEGYVMADSEMVRESKATKQNKYKKIRNKYSQYNKWM